MKLTRAPEWKIQSTLSAKDAKAPGLRPNRSRSRSPNTGSIRWRKLLPGWSYERAEVWCRRAMAATASLPRSKQCTCASVVRKISASKNAPTNPVAPVKKTLRGCARWSNGRPCAAMAPSNSTSLASEETSVSVAARASRFEESDSPGEELCACSKEFVPALAPVGPRAESPPAD